MTQQLPCSCRARSPVPKGIVVCGDGFCEFIQRICTSPTMLMAYLPRLHAGDAADVCRHISNDISPRCRLDTRLTAALFPSAAAEIRCCPRMGHLGRELGARCPAQETEFYTTCWNDDAVTAISSRCEIPCLKPLKTVHSLSAAAAALSRFVYDHLEYWSMERD